MGLQELRTGYDMKVALIAPPFPLDEAPSPPLGLCYVAAAFREAGAEVILLDYIVEKYTPEKMRRSLEEFQPDAVGTTAVTMNFKGAAEILSDVKTFFPDLVTIIGGPHVTFDSADTLRQYPAIDVVALGEAESTIKEFTPQILNRKAWHSIQGISFLDGETLINNERREFIKDLDSIAQPVRDILSVSRYLALGFPVSIITSRGCPYRCIFCQGTRMVGHKIRYREAEQIADEIENILALGFRRINIADDFFTSSKKRVRLLCEEIKRRNIKFEWAAFARVNSVSHELLEMMMEVGCDTISFGLESGNEEMLERVEKHMKLDQARKAAKICKEVGMNVFSSFIVGLPGETKETLQETRDFAEELGTEFGYHFLAPLPGTPIRDEIEKFDLTIQSTDWDEYDANRAIVSTSKLNQQQMEEFVAEYEVGCQDHWNKTETNYRNGTANEMEILKFESRQRLEFIFEVLSEDVIELAAQNLPTTDGQSVTEGLTSTLAVAAKKANVVIDNKVICQTVNHLVEQGYVIPDVDEGRHSWQWTQFPAAIRQQ
tara:strand:- start:10459 stop:12096 length:1638 start_codon:yes stop_codon:yes gene_type:complete